MSMTDHPSFTHSRSGGTETRPSETDLPDNVRRLGAGSSTEHRGVDAHSRTQQGLTRIVSNIDERPARSALTPRDETSDQPDPGFLRQPLPSRHLVVRPWWDPDLAITGHRLDDPYVELFWLGVLGPSTICLLRRLSRGFDLHPEGFRLSVASTARAIGLGPATGRNGPLNRTIDRACNFGLMRRTALDEIDVRLHIPSLSRRQLTRLPVAVQNAHEDWVSENAMPSPGHRFPITPMPAA